MLLVLSGMAYGFRAGKGILRVAIQPECCRLTSAEVCFTLSIPEDTHEAKLEKLLPPDQNSRSES